MTGIRKGGTAITGVYVGSAAAKSVYMGATKVWPPPATLTPTRVAQAKLDSTGGYVSGSLTLPAVNVPAGALIVVKYSGLERTPPTACTDSAGNTYTRAPGVNTDRTQSAIFYCLSATANAATVATLAFDAAANYGASIEVYTGGTWAFDSANSGVVQSGYVTTPLTVSGFATAGAGVIAMCIGQYDDRMPATATASMSPGAIVATCAAGVGPVMASGELLNSAAFSGSITVGINTPTPEYTITSAVYATFLLS